MKKKHKPQRAERVARPPHRMVGISDGVEATGQLLAIEKSLARLLRGLQLFDAGRSQISEWLLVNVRATRGTLELVSLEPRTKFRELLATAEAFSRDCDFRSGSLRVSKYLPNRIDVFHKSNV
jgi:L-rhamnose isomerase